jgi:hypothetical protein
MRLDKVLNEKFIQILKDLSTKEVEISTAYAISELLDSVTQYRGVYEQQRQALLAKYGEKDDSGKLKTSENGEEYVISDIEAFTKEHEKLLSYPIELPKLELKALAGLKMTPVTVSLIKDILKPEIALTESKS